MTKFNEDTRVKIPATITFLDPHNDNMLKVFNDMLIHIEHLQDENERLASLRDFLLPMLMNGQVKIGERGEQDDK